jgi:hypothetical protein
VFKTCCTCKTEKPLNEFNLNKRFKDGINIVCKNCDRLCVRKNYYRFKKIHNDKVIKRRKEKQNEFEKYIKQLGLKCKNCGNDHPAVLDFHHKDPKLKKKNISNLKRSGCSFETFKEEILKCEILCSNCHRIEHWKQKNCRVVEIMADTSNYLLDADKQV